MSGCDRRRSLALGALEFLLEGGFESTTADEAEDDSVPESVWERLMRFAGCELSEGGVVLAVRLVEPLGRIPKWTRLILFLRVCMMKQDVDG